MKRAILIVDVQRDFCRDGALAVGDTESLLTQLEKFIEDARLRGELLVFTQDWHPANHSSFKRNGGQWPAHCEAESPGAELMPTLVAYSDDLVIHKGKDRSADGYVISGALKHEDSMGHAAVMKAGEVQRISAGTGIAHSEFNNSPSEPVHFLQIWLLPSRKGFKPGYAACLAVK
jgi:hypothetical protein